MQSDLAQAEEVLRLFSQIPGAQIAADVKDALRNEKKLTCEFLRTADTFCNNPTPAQELRFSHLHILLACAFSQRPRATIEASIYRLSFAIAGLQNNASEVANEKGRLCELQDEMDAIQRREGLEEGQCWEEGEGPADYWAALAEYFRIAFEIGRVFKAHVLRRYGFRQLAELLETDPMRFEVMQEIGEWLDKPVHYASIRAYRLQALIKDHGPQAKKLYDAMAAEHGLTKPGRSRAKSLPA